MCLEVPVEMTLIGETTDAGDLRERGAGADHPARRRHAAAHQIAMRRGAEGGAERARQGEAIETGDAFKLVRGDRLRELGIEQRTHLLDRAVRRRALARPQPAAPGERIGESGDHAFGRQRIERPGKAGERLVEHGDDGLILGDHVGDEGKPARILESVIERGSDQRGVDVEHAIAEAVGRSRVAVMRFIGMKHHHLSGAADAVGAAIAELLRAGERHADRIGLVPMRVVGMAAEMRNQALDARRRRVGQQEVRRLFHAQTSKTMDGSRRMMPEMMYPTKTALAIRGDLAGWQKANVAAFLTGGLVHRFPEMIGEPYRDADQHLYTPLVREPVFVYGADAAEIRRTYDRARSHDLAFAIYTEPLFKTSNDMDNRASVAGCTRDQLDLVGLGLHADRKIIDKVINGLRFLA